MNHDQDPYLTLLRGLLYLGVFALLGAGVFARWVGPELARQQRWRLWNMLSVGFLLAVYATVGLAWHTVDMLGDPSLLGPYFLQSDQGNVLLVRLVMLGLLLILALGWQRWDRLVYPLLALGLLGTLTLTAHAGARGGLMPLADLVHLSFASLWAGSLLALGLCWPGSRYEQVRQAIHRLSGLGLVSVLGVSLAGVFLALSQLGTLGNLLPSQYGRTLLLKLALVALVVGLAAINRFWLLPRLQNKQIRGLNTVSLEALLMVGVLAMSGVLASTNPPLQAGANSNPIDISQTLGRRLYSGQLYPDIEVVHFFLDIKDERGNILGQGPVLSVKATSQGQPPLTQLVEPFQNAQYHAAFFVPGGVWKFSIELPETTLEYTLSVPGKGK